MRAQSFALWAILFFPVRHMRIKHLTHVYDRIFGNCRQRKKSTYVALMAAAGRKCSFCETFPQDSRYELDKSGTLVFNTHRKDESRSDVSVAQQHVRKALLSIQILNIISFFFYIYSCIISKLSEMYASLIISAFENYCLFILQFLNIKFVIRYNKIIINVSNTLIKKIVDRSWN